MDRFAAMEVFVRVADVRSFAEAARQLGMSPPAVTRAVAALEQSLGTRLFTRTTRAVRLTEAGDRFWEDCKRILGDLSDAEAAARGSYNRPTGTLTITAPVIFGRLYILPILTEFLDLYPDVTGRLVLLDRTVNLIDEGMDLAVRIGHLPDSSHSAIKVGSVRRVVCGAPSYFATHGRPARPADLARHRIILPNSAWTSTQWQFGGAGKTSVELTPRLFCNSNDAAIAAARSGWGVTRQLSYQIGPDLRDGTLEAVLTAFEEPSLPVYILHPDGRRASAKVRAFVDLITARLRPDRLIN
mgnify:FL=1